MRRGSRTGLTSKIGGSDTSGDLHTNDFCFPVANSRSCPFVLPSFRLPWTSMQQSSPSVTIVSFGDLRLRRVMESMDIGAPTLHFEADRGQIR